MQARFGDRLDNSRRPSRPGASATGATSVYDRRDTVDGKGPPSPCPTSARRGQAPTRPHQPISFPGAPVEPPCRVTDACPRAAVRCRAEGDGPPVQERRRQAAGPLWPQPGHSLFCSWQVDPLNLGFCTPSCCCGLVARGPGDGQQVDAGPPPLLLLWRAHRAGGGGHEGGLGTPGPPLFGGPVVAEKAFSGVLDCAAGRRDRVSA